MKKMIRTIAAVVTFTMIAACFTGCAKINTGGGKNSNSSSDLTIGYWNSGYGSAWLEAVIEAFEKKHPEYNVVLNTSAATSGLLAAYGQEGVDETDLYLSVALNDPEYLEPLEDFLDEKIEGEDLTIREKFDADFLEMAKYSDGNHYALPYIGGGVYGLVYNKEIFKENNLSIPRTTNELVVVADSLATEGVPAFCSFQGTGYWKYALDVWYAQYEGQDYYYKNFYACTDENGTSPSKEVLLKKDGRYAVLKAAESLFTPTYVLSGLSLIHI